MRDVEIIYGDIKYIKSFHQALDYVAREKKYIELIEAPPLMKVQGFQASLIEQNGPVFYALAGGKVVGWCDAFPEENERQKHRASIGMGLLPEYRGRGIGGQLLEQVINHSKKIELEKLELHVYTQNENAIRLYKKFGFVEEGLIKNYRQLDGVVYDCLLMAKGLR